MIDKIISELLNQNLGKFIENIDKRQLGASLLKGSLELKNMKLKSTIFDETPLPFALDYGQIGKIKIKIPFWDTFKSPLVIEIIDVFGLVKIKPQEKWNEQQQIQFCQSASQNFLDQFELFMKSQVLIKESENEKECSIVDKLVARIIDNLQISIKNIYFRFEDKINQDDSQKYSLGLKLQEFSVFTGDKNFQKIDKQDDTKKYKDMSDEEKLTYKVAQIKGLSLFCDWVDVDKPENGGINLKELNESKDTSSFEKVLKFEFEERKNQKNILDNLKIRLEITLNKDIRNPIAPASLSFPQIRTKIVIGGKNSKQKNICINQPQILRVLKTIEVIGLFNEFDDRAIKSIKDHRLSKDEQALYIQHYTNWKHLELKDKIKAMDHRNLMKEIENTCFAQQIIPLRKEGYSKFQNLEEKDKELEVIEGQIKAEINKKVGYFTSSAKRAEIEKEIRAAFTEERLKIFQKYKLKESEPSKMKELIDDLNDGEEPDIDFSNLPPEYIRAFFILEIPSFKFDLINEFDQELLCWTTEGFKLQLSLAHSVIISTLKIENLQIEDHWTKSNQWPHLLSSKSGQDKKGQALYVKFEQNAKFKDCPFHLDLRMQNNIKIVGNLPLIMEVVRTISTAVQNEKFDFDYFVQIALDHINQFRSDARKMASNIKHGTYTHQNLSILADLQAPMIIIPEDIQDPNSRYLQVGFGKINVSSDLRNYKKDTDYKSITNEKELYDNYILQQSGLHVSLIEQQNQTKILFDNSFKLQFRNCLEPLHPKFETIRIDLIFDQAILIQSDFILIQKLLNMKNNILTQLLNADYNMVNLKLREEIKVKEEGENLNDSEDDGIGQERNQIELKNQPNLFKAKSIDEKDQTSPVKLIDMPEEKIQLALIEQNTAETVDESNLKFKLDIGQIDLILDCGERSNNLDKLKIVIQMKKMGAELLVGNEGKDIEVKFGIQNIEIKDQQETNSLFEKILFWNQAASLQSKEQISGKLSLQQYELDDAIYGVIKHLQTGIDLCISQSVLNLNLICVARLIDAVADLINMLNDDKMNKKDLMIIQRKHTLQALDEFSDDPSSLKLQNTKRLFQNLQKLLKIDDQEEYQQKVTQILQQSLTELEQVTQLEKEDTLESNLIKEKEQLEKGSEIIGTQQLFVVSQSYKSMKLNVKMQVEQIDVWLNDYDARYSDKNAQILQLKIKMKKEIELEQLITYILCSRSQVYSIQNTDLDLGEKLEEQDRVLKRNIDVKLNMESISIGQTIAESWTKASECNLIGANCITSDMMMPTQIEAHVKLDQQYKLDKIIIVNTDIKQMMLRADYKDVSFLYLFSQRANIQLLPVFEKFLREGRSEIDQLTDKLRNQMKETYQKIFNVVLVQQIQEDYTVSYTRNELTFNDERYQKSIKFYKGEIIYKREEIIFRKEIKTLNVNLPLIKIEFYDGTMNNFMRNNLQRSTPLLQLMINDLDITLNMHNYNEFFDPLDRHTSMTAKRKTYQKKVDIAKRMTEDWPAFIDIYSSLGIEAKYFNQITQVFEPFLEPWQIHATIQQKLEGQLFDIYIESDKFLNVNATYGLAWSLKNISLEVQEILKNVDYLLKMGQKQSSKKFLKSMTSIPDFNNDFFQKNIIQFINGSGLDITLRKSHDADDSSRVLKLESANPFDPTVCPEVEIEVRENIENSFFEEKTKNYGNHDLEFQNIQIEKELLSIDLKILGINTIKNVQIEKNGIFSFQSEYSWEKRPINVILLIKTDSHIRMVSFESQLRFQNNFNHPLTFEFEFQRYEGEDQINKKQEFLQVQIEPQGTFKVPLSWYLLEHIVSVYIIKKKEQNNDEDDAEKKKRLLFHDITKKFNLTAENPALPTNVFSQYIELNKDFYVSVDIYGYKCLPAETADKNPLQFIVEFNPPLKIQNLSVSPLTISEIDNPGTKQELSKILSKIPPSMADEVIALDLSPQNQSDIMIQLRDNDKNLFLSKIMRQLASTNQVKQDSGCIVFSEEFICHKHENESNLRELQNSGNCATSKIHFEITQRQPIDIEGREVAIHESRAIDVKIFSKYMVVNRSKYELFHGKQMIPAHTNEYLLMENDQTECVLSSWEYKQSHPIDLTTPGQSGVVTLDSNDQNSNNQLQFGVSIKNPSPFTKTIVMTIAPRYMLFNKLGSPLLVQQADSKNSFVIEKDAFKEIHMHKTKNLLNQISFRIVQESQLNNLDQIRQHPKLWSQPFIIDQASDFQTEFKIEGYDYSQENTEPWHCPKKQNNRNKLVRVIVTPNPDEESAMVIILDNPTLKEYIIENKTQYDFEFCKYNHIDKKGLDDLQNLELGQQKVFAWSFQGVSDRFLFIKVNGAKHSNIVSLDKITKKTDKRQVLFLIDDGEQIYTTLQITEDGTKILKIRQTNIKQKEQQIEEEKQQVETIAEGVHLSLKLAGIGISVLDNVPKELAYVFADKLFFEFSLKQHVQGDITETKTELNAAVANIQIDNLVNEEYPVIFGPQKIYKPLIYDKVNTSKLQKLYRNIDNLIFQEESKGNETEKNSDHTCPFFKMEIVKTERRHKGRLGSIVKFETIHLAMQEFFIQIETSIIVQNLKFIMKMANLIESSQQMTIVQSEDQYEFQKLKKRQEILPLLDAQSTKTFDESKFDLNKKSFGVIDIGTLKILVTIKIEQGFRLDEEIRTNSRATNAVIHTLAPFVQNFVQISNSKIQLNELVIVEAFLPPEVLQNNIISHYKYQIKKQLLRILGSSNLLGNPANLLGNAGQGVYELARDPLQGMMQGPSGFAKGIGTGMQGAVKGVVGGSFESLSNVTGSLYSVMKHATGQEDMRQVKKAENLRQGLSQGVTGIGSEIAKGVGGLFSNPMKGAKTGGIKGFGKGLGKGIIGAVSAPVTGILRAGESVSQGISGSATNFSNIGKAVIDQIDSKSFRVRVSRRIDQKGHIKIYDEDLAIVGKFLKTFDNKKFSNQQIRYFDILPQLDLNGNILEDKALLLVITTDYLMTFEILNFVNLMKNMKVSSAIKLCTRLDEIIDYEVFLSPNNYQKTQLSYQKCLFLKIIALDNTHSVPNKAVEVPIDGPINTINSSLQSKKSHLAINFAESSTLNTVYFDSKRGFEGLKMTKDEFYHVKYQKKKREMLFLPDDYDSFDRVHTILSRIPSIRNNMQAAQMIKEGRDIKEIEYDFQVSQC